jgi:hypothetical protein
MMDLSVYRTRFDQFVEIYGDGSDEMIREDVNEEMRKRWPFYALAGVDIMKISEMLSDADAWYYYQALENFGAKLDVQRFIQAFDARFIKKNWSLFLKRGASVEELKAACFK